MKKLLSLFAVLAFAGVMTSCDDDDAPQPEYYLRTLTFEDSDYKGSGNFLGNKDWSSLIDSKQNEGELLYGENAPMYNWYDEGNTELTFAGFPTNNGVTKFYNGGEAISNYVQTDIALGDIPTQLSVPFKNGGHNGSKNFAIHFGNRTDYSPELPQLAFADGKARIIDHLFIAPTTFFLNVVKNGNAFSPAATEKDWVKVTATGFDQQGEPCGTAEFYMVKEGKPIGDWTMWDLSSLGKVMIVEFDMTSSIANGSGMTVPAYFAYDDVTVRFYPADFEE